MMDAPSYQRAVTPSAEASNSARPAPVRGKMLSYSRKQSSTGSVLSEAAMSPAGSVAASRVSGGARKHSTYVIAPPPSIDINVQGRTATGVFSVSNIGKVAVNAKAGASSDSQSQGYFLSNSKGNSDLEPLSDEIPPDGVVFARSRSAPNSLVVFRTQEEKMRNPERLNLDRRQLDVCPLLKNEQRLRLLNYQNNNIRTMSNLENLPNLIFLDLYNNKLNTLDGPLSTLRGLRVLMIGKNRISDITNLTNLKKLDVLDLHSNDIGEITGLDGLADLRVLNLAGNRIRTVINLSSLMSLTELNLRRNSIERIYDLDAIPSLQRIFLSHNLIKYMSDIKCIYGLKTLIELSLDGNPISTGGNQAKYRYTVITEMPALKHLDLQKITDEERRLPGVLEAAVAPVVDETASVGTASINMIQTNGQHQLLHLSKFLGTVGGLPPSGSVPGSRLGTSHAIRSKDSGSDSENPQAQIIPAPVRKNSKDSISSGNASSSEKVCVDPTNLGTIGLLRMSSAGLSPAPTPAQTSPSKPSSKMAQERVFAMNSLEIYDLPGAGNSKCLQATGETWEWNQTRRTLSLITTATIDRMRISVLAPRFASHAILLSGLKKLTLIANDVSSLNEILILGHLFPTVEHLVFNRQPIEELSPALLQGAIITSFPKLKSYNQLPISTEERELSLNIYGTIFRADANNSLLATMSAAVQSFEASDPDGLPPKGSNEVMSTDSAGGDDNVGISITSPTDVASVLVPTPVLASGVPGTRSIQLAVGCNIGGSFSCIFGSVACSTAIKANQEAVKIALRARELERNGFDEVFASALSEILLESIEDL